jgi:hypothetical protein
MKIRQFTNLPGFATSLKIVAASSLAMGVVAGISAAPASAVVIAPGSVLALNDGVLNTLGTLTPGLTGSTFQATFAGNGGGPVSTASGTFASIFAAIGPTATPTGLKYFTANPVSFQQVGASATIPGGIDYAPTAPLVFTFPTGPTATGATLATLTLPSGTRFLYSGAPAAGSGVARSSFNIYTTPSFGGVFTTGGNSTNLNFTSFSFDVDNLDNTNPLNISPNGSFSFVATVPGSTAVPEPFTIIGTLVGGTAALRMRKKLASSVKN